MADIEKIQQTEDLVDKKKADAEQVYNQANDVSGDSWADELMSDDVRKQPQAPKKVQPTPKGTGDAWADAMMSDDVRNVKQPVSVEQPVEQNTQPAPVKQVENVDNNQYKGEDLGQITVTYDKSTNKQTTSVAEPVPQEQPSKPLYDYTKAPEWRGEPDSWRYTRTIKTYDEGHPLAQAARQAKQYGSLLSADELSAVYANKDWDDLNRQSQELMRNNPTRPKGGTPQFEHDAQLLSAIHNQMVALEYNFADRNDMYRNIGQKNYRMFLEPMRKGNKYTEFYENLYNSGANLRNSNPLLLDLPDKVEAQKAADEKAGKKKPDNYYFNMALKDKDFKERYHAWSFFGSIQDNMGWNEYKNLGAKASDLREERYKEESAKRFAESSLYAPVSALLDNSVAQAVMAVGNAYDVIKGQPLRSESVNDLLQRSMKYAGEGKNVVRGVLSFIPEAVSIMPVTGVAATKAVGALSKVFTFTPRAMKITTGGLSFMGFEMAKSALGSWSQGREIDWAEMAGNSAKGFLLGAGGSLISEGVAGIKPNINSTVANYAIQGAGKVAETGLFASTEMAMAYLGNDKEATWTSSLLNNGALIISMAIGHGIGNGFGFKSRIGNATIEKVRKAGYNTLANEMAKHTQAVERGAMPKGYTQAAIEEMQSMQQSMGSNGLSWSDYAEVLKPINSKMTKPGTNSIEKVEDGKGYRIVSYDVNGVEIERSKVYDEWAVDKEFAKRQRAVEKKREEANVKSFDLMRDSTIKAKAARSVADRINFDDGKSVYNGDGTVNEAFDGITADDVLYAYEALSEKPAEQRSSDEARIVALFDEAVRDYGEEMPDSNAVKKTLCVRYGVEESAFDAAWKADAKDRKGREAEICATYNSIMSRPYEVALNGGEAGTVDGRQVSIKSAVKTDAEGMPLDPNQRVYYDDGTGVKVTTAEHVLMEPTVEDPGTLGDRIANENLRKALEAKKEALKSMFAEIPTDVLESNLDIARTAIENGEDTDGSMRLTYIALEEEIQRRRNLGVEGTIAPTAEESAPIEIDADGNVIEGEEAAPIEINERGEVVEKEPVEAPKPENEIKPVAVPEVDAERNRKIDELLDFMGYQGKERDDARDSYLASPEALEEDYSDYLAEAQKEVPKKEEPVEEKAPAPEEEPSVDNSPQEQKVVDNLDEPMPLLEDGEPNVDLATPRRTRKYLYEESGLEAQDATDKIDYEIKKAKENAKKAEKSAPKMGDKGIDGNIGKFKKAQQEWNDKKAAADAKLEYWNEVKRQQGLYDLIDEIGNTKNPKPMADLVVKLKSRFRNDREILNALNTSSVEPRTVYEACMHYLSSGARFIWDSDGARKGLKQELGYGEGERKKMIGLLSKDGTTVQKAVHDIIDQYGADLGLDLSESQVVYDTLLEALGSISTKGDVYAFINERRLHAVEDILRKRLGNGDVQSREEAEADARANEEFETLKEEYKDELPENPTEDDVLNLMEQKRQEREDMLKPSQGMSGEEALRAEKQRLQEEIEKRRYAVENSEDEFVRNAAQRQIKEREERIAEIDKQLGESKNEEPLPNENGITDDFFAQNEGEQPPFSLKQEGENGKETVAKDVREHLEQNVGKELTDRIEDVAKRMGVEVRLTDMNVNGVMSSGVLYIGKKLDPDKTATFVAGHEFTHEMQYRAEGKGSDVYDIFKDAALEWAKNHPEEGGKGFNFDYLKGLYERFFKDKFKRDALGRGVSEEDADAYAERLAKDRVTDDYINDEITANVAGRMLENPTIADDMFKLREAEAPQERRNALRRFLDWIKEYISKRIGNKKEEELTPEEQRLIELRDKFNDMYNEVVREDLDSQGIATSENGDAAYSIRSLPNKEQREKLVEGLMEQYSLKEDLGREDIKDNDPSNEGKVRYSLREEDPPKKTDVGYKVFYLKNGKLYPPMVANLDRGATPVGVWLNADAAPVASVSKTGRMKVKAGGKGTQGSGGPLAYRPGWHLGEIPYALQFNRGKDVDNPLGIRNKKGQIIKVGEFFPGNFVWAEVEYANDIDYQKEAESYGMKENGKFQHALAGLPRIPKDGSYRYRTNPNPATDPWIITGAMRVNKILKPSEVDEMVRAAGREPQKREANAVTDEQIEQLNRELGLNSENISEAQYSLKEDDMRKQQESKNFKDWFGDWENDPENASKVVDKEGRPKVVYHQTNSKRYINKETGEDWDLLDPLERDKWENRDDWNEHWEEQDFYKFDDRFARQSVEVPGFFFAPKEDPYHEYGKRTIAAYLDIKKPAIDPDMSNLGYTDYAGRELMERLESEGYDGIIMTENGEPYEYIAFHPEQIKSATENNGDFSRENPDIRYSIADRGAQLNRESKRDSEESRRLFDATKEKFGTTNDIREAGYILPDGTMLDFSGRYMVDEGHDTSHLSGRRAVDHRAIYEVGYDKEENKTGFETDMADFVGRGAIRIDSNAGTINLSMAPTKEQARVLQQLIARNGGDVTVDFGDGYNNEHYAEYEGARATRVLGDIDRFFGEGIKPEGNIRYALGEEEQQSDLAARLRERMRQRMERARSANNGGEEPRTESGSSGGVVPPVEPPTPPAPATPEPAPELPPTGYDRPMSPIEIAQEAAIKVVADTKASLEQRNTARRELDASLKNLHKAMRLQKEYDRTTVENVVSLCKMMVQSGLIDRRYISNLTPLFTKLKDATGKEDLTSTVNGIMDVMLKSQERSIRNEIAKLLKVTGTKVDENGVVKQAGLDIRGQHTMKELSEYMDKGSRIIDNRIEKLEEMRERIGDDDTDRLNEIDDKILGCQLAKQFSEIEETHGVNISEAEGDLEYLKERYKSGEIGIKEYTEQKHALENLIRSYRMAQTDALWNQIKAINWVITDSKEGSRNWIERQKQHKGEILHNAYSDMEGTPSYTQGDTTKMQEISNSALPKFFSSSLFTLQTMLKSLGNKHAMGEGYLYNRFFKGWMEQRDAEITEYRNDMNTLNAKAKELTGHSYFGIYKMIQKLPNMTVEYYDGGEMRPHELDQGQLGYAYMVNKMEDGAAALRNMGISEEKMQEIANFLNPKLKEFYDWLQDDFLAGKWDGMNEVHKRMFGADMDRVANYIPLRRDREAGKQKVDISQESEPPLQSTVVGSIIQRVHSNLGIDLKHSNAIDVVANHLLEATHWKHFSEWKRDSNTLLSDTKFRNKVKNSTTIYGSGKILWERLNQVFQIAGGDYKPSAKASSVDKAIVDMARTVNTAKVSMRVFTATKQLLSLPVFATECNPAILLKNVAFLLSPVKISGNPAQNSFVWCMQNLPQFRERWVSRIAGETRLENGDLGWGYSRQKVLEMAGRIGLTPNAFIDACTVAAGAKSIYEKRYKQYKKDGYSEEVADKKAKIDAEVAFNESQQSSEKAFVSPIQVDRTAVALGLSTFRNASMGYERKFVDAVRNFKHLTMGGKEYKEMLVKRKEKELIEQGMDKAEARAAAEKEYKNMLGAKAYREVTMEFMKKQMERDGLTETQAKDAAERLYRRSLWRSTLNFLMFGFGAQMAWNVGGKLPYLIFGDDDEEKKKIYKQAAVHAGIGGWIEGMPAGDMLSEGMTNWAMNLIDNGNPLEGTSFFEFDPDLLTVTSDAVKVTKYLEGKNPLKGATAFVNLLGQIYTGVNPETFSDAGVAIYDACNGDPEVGNEALMCILRIMQCPQSQLDQMYIDELKMSARQAQNLTPEEVARRYAYYKAHKDTPYMWWMYNQSKKDEIVKKYEGDFTKKLNTDVKEAGGTPEDYHDLMESSTTNKEHDKYRNKEIDALSAQGPEALMKAWEKERDKGAAADYKYMKSLMTRYQKDVYGKGKTPDDADEAYEALHGEDIKEQAQKIGRDLGFGAQDSYFQMSQYKAQHTSAKDPVMKEFSENDGGFKYSKEGKFFKMDEYNYKVPVKDVAKREKALKVMKNHKEELRRNYRNGWRMAKIKALYKDIEAESLKKERDHDKMKSHFAEIIQILEDERKDAAEWEKKHPAKK